MIALIILNAAPLSRLLEIIQNSVSTESQKAAEIESSPEQLEPHWWELRIFNLPSNSNNNNKNQVTNEIGIAELIDSSGSVSGLKQNFRTLMSNSVSYVNVHCICKVNDWNSYISDE